MIKFTTDDTPPAAKKPVAAAPKPEPKADKPTPAKPGKKVAKADEGA